MGAMYMYIGCVYGCYICNIQFSSSTCPPDTFTYAIVSSRHYFISQSLLNIVRGDTLTQDNIMSYPNPNPNPILGHNFIAPSVSNRNLYKILSGGTLQNRTLLCLTYTCIQKVYMDGVYMYIDYMYIGAIYMYIDCVYGCYIHAHVY